MAERVTAYPILAEKGNKQVKKQFERSRNIGRAQHNFFKVLIRVKLEIEQKKLCRENFSVRKLQTTTINLSIQGNPLIFGNLKIPAAKKVLSTQNCNYRFSHQQLQSRFLKVIKANLEIQLEKKCF